MLYAPILSEMPKEEFALKVADAFAVNQRLMAIVDGEGREVVEALGNGQVRWRVFDVAGGLVGSISGRLIAWREAVELAPPGLVLEFGVRYGTTIKAIAEAGRPVFGFDWWKASCVCDRPQDLPSNVVLIEGLFSDTLEGFLEVHSDPVAFVNLDCDLFTSSFYVLRCLMGRFVKGSVIAFSAITFSQAMRRAFDRYLKESGQTWELIGKQHWAGEVYRCDG